MVVDRDELSRRAATLRGGNSTPTAASIAAASRARCSKPASAWCCRAAPTSRPKRTRACVKIKTRRTSTRRPGVFQHAAAHLLACRHLRGRRQVHPLRRSTGGEVRVEEHALCLLGQALHRRASRRAGHGRMRLISHAESGDRPSAANGNATRAALTRGFVWGQPAAGRPKAQSRHGRQSHPPRRPPLRREHAAHSGDGDTAPIGLLGDTLGRPLHDLRISVTDRCNFRCSYCMPKEVFDKHYTFSAARVAAEFRGDHALSAKLFVAHGVRKIRLTGGEPLLRKPPRGACRDAR